MIKIVKSLAMIALVGAVALGITGAYFSDTETSGGNTIAAGSLDLSLNNQNGGTASAVVTIDDMKPCEVRYSDIITLHVDDNPGRLYKHIVRPIVCSTGRLTEPECTDQDGYYEGDVCYWLTAINVQGDCTGDTRKWENDKCYDSAFDPNPDKNYLPEITWFDLWVWVTDPTSPTVPCDPNDDNCDAVMCGDGGVAPTTECWDIIIPDGKITVDQIASRMIYLGTYGTFREEGNTITIRQSFHMKAEAENEYQGDTCSFDEEFKVLQVSDGVPHPSTVCIPSMTNGCE